MAGKNQALVHVLGCRSFAQMQSLVNSTVDIKHNVLGWIDSTRLPWYTTAQPESLTALFPWAVIDVFVLRILRLAWLLCVTCFSIHVLFENSVLSHFTWKPSHFIVLLVTVCYGIVLAQVLYTMRAAGFVVIRMPS